MSSHFTVIYDACVLYPAPLRDLLMRLARPATAEGWKPEWRPGLQSWQWSGLFGAGSDHGS